MMSDQEKSMALIEPLFADLHDAWHSALHLYQSDYPPNVRAEHDDALAAQCVRRHMLLELMRRLDGRDGCALLNVQGFRILNFRDQAVLRFKKVDGAGRHSAYRTDQQMEFDDQEPLTGIPEAAVRLTCGYQLDQAGEEIDRIIIARPTGRSIAWTAQVILLEEKAAWVDITPARFAGTDRIDFRRRRGGGGQT
jgi:hypothetical protein